MKNVTTEFAEYGLEEIGEEFISTATESEKEYILPKTVGGTKVHLPLGVKKTRIQILPSGVGVYLIPFKDVEGSSIIFLGLNKMFTQVNKDQQRDSSHAVYSCNTLMHGQE